MLYAKCRQSQAVPAFLLGFSMFSSRRHIRRSPMDSSESLPESGCGTQAPRYWVLQSGVKAATGIRVGPVKVEFAGVVKSTWNLNRSRLALPEGSSTITKLGVPAAGGVAPSKSEGSMPK